MLTVSSPILDMLDGFIVIFPVELGVLRLMRRLPFLVELFLPSFLLLPPPLVVLLWPLVLLSLLSSWPSPEIFLVRCGLLPFSSRVVLDVSLAMDGPWYPGSHNGVVVCINQ